MKMPLALLLAVVCATAAEAQILVDTTFSWRGYAAVSTCRVRIYRSAPSARRPFTIVLEEQGGNAGRSTLDDAPYLAEQVGRAFDVPPETAFWIYHWGWFSFTGAEPSRREIFFRATFTRSDAGSLAAPFWRLVNRETIAEYTDRAFR